MRINQRLLEKVKMKNMKVGVIGLGYVGLPLAVEKALAGYDVTGFDVQQEKVNKVNQGINYIGDVVAGDLQKLAKERKLKATTDYGFIKDMDFIAICVPTPLNAHKEPDLSYVIKSSEEIGKYLTPYTVVVLESTTYPGTTEEIVLPILEEKSGLKCGEDFYLGFSPERVDPGNLIYKTKNTPKVVGGVGKDATEVIASMYRHVLQGDVMEVSSPRVAEMSKLLENTYRHVNIALANEMAIICHKMGINVWEVIEAAKTKPYGFQAFYPGPGVGGHCIPLDPYYLVWKAKEFGHTAKLIEASGEINDFMPGYVVQRAADILNKDKKPLNGSKILILGVAYKQDIDDYRESPAVKVISELMGKGAEVCFYDPYIREFRYNGELHVGLETLSTELIKEQNLVIITTAHTQIDYSIIIKEASRILDTKHVLVTKPLEKYEVL